jgi:hypothetical protein
VFYAWRKARRKDSAFALHHNPAWRFTFTPAKLKHFNRLVSKSSPVRIERILGRCASTWNISSRTIRRHLPANVRKEIRRMQHARGIVKRTERRFKEACRIA